MSPSSKSPATAVQSPPRFQLNTLIPSLRWLRAYKQADLVGDLMAGLIVAVMLVPQGMAYALLAGLPPEVGLYASILPLVLYGIFGTSRVLAVGPVAIVSLLVASGIAPLAEAGLGSYIQLAITLALLVGIVQAVMGLVRLGFLVNFMSHQVLAGFTSAAALVIGFSQLKHLLGVNIPRLEFFEMVAYAVEHISETNPATFAIGGICVLILLYFKYGLRSLLERVGVKESLALPLTKIAPLIIVLVSTAVVWRMGLDGVAGVKVVGDVPAGLPPLTMPTVDTAVWQKLLPIALTISFVGYMESIAVAKSLASKRRQKVDANQELIALGISNFGAAVTGGFPVTGGFSRSVVNYDAGARTGLASMITALLILLTVVFLTPLFYYLPQAVLAAIVMVAVIGLIDIRSLVHVWYYNKADAASYVITFGSVLIYGVEVGILVGVAAAMLLFIWRTSRPHVAIVGRLGESEIYRNVERHPVMTWPNVVAVRIDQSLYFANTKFLEDTVLGIVAEKPDVAHFVLIGTAVNFIDASALETLESLNTQLKDAGVTLHMAAIKGPVMDKLQAVGFVDKIGAEKFHLCTHDAMKALGVI